MLIQWVIPALVFLTVLCIGGAIVAGAVHRRRALQPRLHSSRDLFDSHRANHGLARVASTVGSKVSSGRTSLTLKEQLARAGLHGSSAAATYLGAKFILLIVGLVGAAVLLLWLDLNAFFEIYLAVMMSVVFFFIPNVYMASRRRARRNEVKRHLPDVIDLLEICVTAGMGLDAAWNAVTDEVRPVSPVMADEMSLTMLETQLGAPRTAAMRHMAERTGADELASLVALLVQSDRFGTSVAEALRTFANSMREKRSQHAEEEAEKTAVKLLFPLVLLIFPAMLIVMVGPALLTLNEIINRP